MFSFFPSLTDHTIQNFDGSTSSIKSAQNGENYHGGTNKVEYILIECI